MKNVLKIIKINILAILAFPLLALATAAKLAAKALEKTVTIIGAVFIMLGISLIFEIMKNPSQWFNGFLVVTLLRLSLMSLKKCRPASAVLREMPGAKSEYFIGV